AAIDTRSLTPPCGTVAATVGRHLHGLLDARRETEIAWGPGSSCRALRRRRRIGRSFFVTLDG
ncbi:MAG: hypothetical protein AAGD11_21070, partial [Planctomycetota bacterium]